MTRVLCFIAGAVVSFLGAAYVEGLLSKADDEPASEECNDNSVKGEEE